MRWLVLTILCAACGRISFAPLADGAVDGVDVLFPTGPFGTPVPVGELNTTSDEDDISLTGDLLEIYFMTSRAGPNQLYRSTRSQSTDPWSAPSEVTEVGSDLNNPRVSNDGLSLYFTSRAAPNQGMGDLWVASRPDRVAPWANPEPLPGVNTAENELEPWVLDSRLVMYFTVSGSGIVRAERSSPSAAFGPPAVIDAIGGAGYEGTAWVDEGERIVMFHSDRTPDRELYAATRTSSAEAWPAPVLMADLNSTSADSDIWMSPDGHVVFFVSSRNGGYDVFMATR